MVLRNTVRYGSVPPMGTRAPAKTQRVVTFARSTYQRRPSAVEDTPDEIQVPGDRDGWSAYNLSNAALDEFDDLAYKSKRRDAEMLSEANRCLEQVDVLASLPAYKPKYRRSVPPASKLAAAPIAAVKVRTVTTTPSTVKPAKQLASASPAVLKAYIDRRVGKQPPTVYDFDEQYEQQLTTVANKGDLLKAENKLLAAEVANFEAPSTVATLKARLREATDLADRQKLLLDRYITDPDADEAKFHLEKIRVSSEQRLEAKPETASLPKVSPLRSHLRDVLKRCGKNYTGGDS